MTAGTSETRLQEALWLPLSLSLKTPCSNPPACSHPPPSEQAQAGLLDDEKPGGRCKEESEESVSPAEAM